MSGTGAPYALQFSRPSLVGESDKNSDFPRRRKRLRDRSRDEKPRTRDPEDSRTPRYSLQPLAVRPARAGKGFGSSCRRQLFARAAQAITWGDCCWRTWAPLLDASTSEPAWSEVRWNSSAGLECTRKRSKFEMFIFERVSAACSTVAARGRAGSRELANAAPVSAAASRTTTAAGAFLVGPALLARLRHSAQSRPARGQGQDEEEVEASG